LEGRGRKEDEAPDLERNRNEEGPPAEEEEEKEEDDVGLCSNVDLCLEQFYFYAKKDMTRQPERTGKKPGK
jgi:hypothetical protein